jgi:hypothetical protein
MLRLSRRLRPVSGSRCFNSMQIRGQRRLLHVFLRVFGVHRRQLCWILNSSTRRNSCASGVRTKRRCRTTSRLKSA